MNKFYGFLSNAHTAALLSPNGSIDWLAFPRFDSPAVFARLLGSEDNGFFRVYPTAGGEASQLYHDRTNIIVTTWTSEAGRAVVHDYLTIGRTELRRLIKTEIPMTVELRPRFQYGLVSPSPSAVNRGAIFQNPLAREALVLAIIEDPDTVTDTVTCQLNEGRWELPPGQYEFVLQYLADDKQGLSDAADELQDQLLSAEKDLEDEKPNEALSHTVGYWHQRLNQIPPYHGPHRETFIRSLLVLDGLTYRTNGAIIAAPTTSLPETVGESRQWDYRFAWVRDGSYAAEALLEAGSHVACQRFLEFLLNSIDLQGKPFQAPFFHVDGTLIRGERDLDWLSGFRGSVPCREGNGATRQTQLDIEGEFVWTVWRYYEITGNEEFLHFYWYVLKSTIDWVHRNWRQKDASLWEFRGQDAHYTHSKLMCWVALHYGAKLAEAMGDLTSAHRWEAAAQEIRTAIDRDGFNSHLGYYVQSFHGEAVDAALLVMPLYDYVAADDPRFLATLAQIEKELVRGFWVHRYASDMLGGASHPFVLASFWLARIYIRLSRIDDAQRILRGLLANQTDLGLLGEHADQTSGEPRGNFPQGFSHLGMIMTLLELTRHQDSKPAYVEEVPGS